MIQLQCCGQLQCTFTDNKMKSCRCMHCNVMEHMQNSGKTIGSKERHYQADSFKNQHKQKTFRYYINASTNAMYTFAKVLSPLDLTIASGAQPGFWKGGTDWLTSLGQPSVRRHRSEHPRIHQYPSALYVYTRMSTREYTNTLHLCTSTHE